MFIRQIFSSEKSVNLTIQGTRFIVVGIFTASLDFILLYLFTEAFKSHYLVSSCVAFLVAVSLNYMLSIKWVFIDGKFSRQYEYLLFLILSGCGLLLNALVMWISVEILFLHYMIGKTLSMVFVTLWNFFGKKKLVFAG